MKKLILILLTISLSHSALGGWIYSNSMPAGKDVTNAFNGIAVLNWADKGTNKSCEFQSLQVNQSNTEYLGNHSKYFGGAQNISSTFNVMDLYLEHAYPLYAPTPEQSLYKALSIAFLQPVSTFSFKAESFSGDSQVVLFFDSKGNFINYQDLSYTSSKPHPGTGVLLDYNYSFDLSNQDVASVIVGSLSAATYYYALEIQAMSHRVPEPSSVLLLMSALVLLISLRVHKQSLKSRI